MPTSQYLQANLVFDLLIRGLFQPVADLAEYSSNLPELDHNDNAKKSKEQLSAGHRLARADRFRFGLLNGFGTAAFGTDSTVLSARVNRSVASGPSIISGLPFMLVERGFIFFRSRYEGFHPDYQMDVVNMMSLGGRSQQPVRFHTYFAN